MRKWQSMMLGLAAAGAAAQVLAQDDTQPVRPVPSSPALQSGQAPLPAPSNGAVMQDPAVTGGTTFSSAPAPAVSRNVEKAAPDTGRTTPNRDRDAVSPPDSAPPRMTEAGHRPRYAGDEFRYRLGYRSARGDHGGADWPLDQNRRYAGPRDAYGGRWIYVRPARRPHGRYGSRTSPRNGGYERRVYDDRGFRTARPYRQQAWRSAPPYGSYRWQYD